jgi:hypothetical protein
LVSSIFAIKNTLGRRYNALKGILEETTKNPNLFNQRHKLDGFDVDSIEDFEDLEDDERDALENILSDPKKFKLFTTAKSLGEIQAEANEVKKLYEMAESLYNRKQEEKKFQELSKSTRPAQVLETPSKPAILASKTDNPFADLSPDKKVQGKAVEPPQTPEILPPKATFTFGSFAQQQNTNTSNSWICGNWRTISCHQIYRKCYRRV